VLGPRAHAGLASLLLVAAAIAYWQWRVLAPIPPGQDVSVLTQDLYTIYVPLHAFAFGADGFLPWWNPYQLAGAPSVGSYNGGLLFPLNWLSWLLPVPEALGWICVASLALAGIGTFACARALGLSLPASVLGGALFMLGQTLVFTHLQPSFLIGSALIPLVFLLGGRLLAAPSLGRGAALGVALALQVLSGHAQIVVYNAYAAGFAALAWLLLSGWRPSRSWLRLAGALAVAAGVTVLLAAAQILPTAEVVSEAARQSLTPAQARPVEPPLGWGAALFAAGPVALFAVLALFDRRRLAIVLAGIALVAVALPIGFGTRLFDDFFFHLPLVDRFRMPMRMLLPAAFAAAVLAAIGLDVAKGWLARIGGARVAAACAWLLVLCTLAERFAANPNRLRIPQSSGEAYFEPKPFAHFLREHAGPDRTLLIKNWGRRFDLMEKLGSLHGIHVVQDFEPLTSDRYRRFLGLPPWANPDAPLFWGRYVAPPAGAQWRMLDLMATRWVAADLAVGWQTGLPPWFREAFRDDEARVGVWENRRSRPRAALLSGAVVIEDDDAALEYLRSERFQPRREVVVDRTVVWPANSISAPTRSGVEWVRDAPEEVRLRVATARPAVLVLADLFWPGWEVAVDGEPRPLLRANYLFRGVALGAGEHDVRFLYRPMSRRVGVAVSLLTGAGLVLWAVARSLRSSGGKY